MNANKHLKPNVTESMVVELGDRLFGLEVLSVKEMVSYEDRNFHLTVSPKHRNPHLGGVWPHGYTLKVINPQKSSTTDNFDSMHAVMNHLNSKGLTLPLPISNITGSTWTLQEIPALPIDENGGTTEGKQRKYLCVVFMQTYLPGVTVGSISHETDVLYQWGQLLACFHFALQDFTYPGLENKAPFWDFSHIPEIGNYMDDLSDQKQILVREVLARYTEDVTKISSLRKGLLHGDFNENNVIVRSINENASDSDNVMQRYIVDGILDLEDVHYGTYTWDVAVMMAYTMLNCSTINPLDGAGYALAGYLSKGSLSQEEISFLKICLSCRLSQSYVLCHYFHSIYPENSYLVSAHKEKWRMLKIIWNTPKEVLIEKWNDICKQCIFMNLNTKM